MAFSAEFLLVKERLFVERVEALELLVQGLLRREAVPL